MHLRVALAAPVLAVVLSVSVSATPAVVAAPVQAGSAATDALVPGGHVAFTRDASIYVMNANGTAEHRLTRNTLDQEPAGSPDGTHIAFVRQLGLHLQVFVMDRQGGHVRQLTFGSQDAFRPNWSPDGTGIAFGRGFNQTQIFVVNVTTLKTRRVSDGAGSVAWSPDGRWLALDVVVNGRTGIYVERPDGTRRHRITPPAVWATNPDWSPDGKQLCFTWLDRSDLNRADLAMIRPDGSGLTRLTRRHQGQDLECSWSPPSDHYIAFQRAVFGTPTTPPSDRIHIISLDNPLGRPITLPAPNTNGTGPDWIR